MPCLETISKYRKTKALLTKFSAFLQRNHWRRYEVLLLLNLFFPNSYILYCILFCNFKYLFSPWIKTDKLTLDSLSHKSEVLKFMNLSCFLFFFPFNFNLKMHGFMNLIAASQQEKGKWPDATAFSISSIV